METTIQNITEVQSIVAALANTNSIKSVLSKLSLDNLKLLQIEISNFKPVISEERKKELSNSLKLMLDEIKNIHTEIGLGIKITLNQDGFIKRITVKDPIKKQQKLEEPPISDEDWKKINCRLGNSFKLKNVRLCCNRYNISGNIKKKLKELLAQNIISKSPEHAICPTTKLTGKAIYYRVLPAYYKIKQ